MALAFRALLLILGCLATSLAGAQGFSNLANLPGVQTRPAPSWPAAADEFGLEQNFLRGTVEGLLRERGVPRPKAALEGDPGLEIEIFVAPLGRSSSRLVNLRLQLVEMVRPQRENGNLVEFSAPTWSKAAVMVTGNTETVVAKLKEMTEAFVEEWREANPRAR